MDFGGGFSGHLVGIGMLYLYLLFVDSISSISEWFLFHASLFIFIGHSVEHLRFILISLLFSHMHYQPCIQHLLPFFDSSLSFFIYYLFLKVHPIITIRRCSDETLLLSNTLDGW